MMAAGYFMVPEQQTQDEYLEWKHRYGYTWPQEDDFFRRMIFLRNVEKIAAHNADESQTYKMGINQFSGLTDREFQMLYLNYRNNPNIEKNEDVTMGPINADVDWTTKGKVSGVKNQCSC